MLKNKEDQTLAEKQRKMTFLDSELQLLSDEVQRYSSNETWQRETIFGNLICHDHWKGMIRPSMWRRANKFVAISYRLEKWEISLRCNRWTCVCPCCPDPAWQIRHSLLVLKIKILTRILTHSLSHTHKYMWAVSHVHTRAGTADCLQGQTGGSAASLTPLVHVSIFRPLPSLFLPLSERVTFLPSSSLHFLPSISMCQCSRSLPPISLFSSPPFLFPSSSPGRSTPDLLPWPFAPTLPSNTSCQSSLPMAVREKPVAVQI